MSEHERHQLAFTVNRLLKKGPVTVGFFAGSDASPFRIVRDPLEIVPAIEDLIRFESVNDNPLTCRQMLAN